MLYNDSLRNLVYTLWQLSHTCSIISSPDFVAEYWGSASTDGFVWIVESSRTGKRGWSEDRQTRLAPAFLGRVSSRRWWPGIRGGPLESHFPRISAPCPGMLPTLSPTLGVSSGRELLAVICCFRYSVSAARATAARERTGRKLTR